MNTHSSNQSRPSDFLFAFTLSAFLMLSGPVFAGDESITSSGHIGPSTNLTLMTMQDAQSRMPILTDPGQLPPGITPAPPPSGVAPSAYGIGAHPFTTKVAMVHRNNKAIFNPKSGSFRQTGKLWMRFGSSWYVCTASVIRKSVIVTAAHCVSDFGGGVGSIANEVIFEPARFGADKLLGQWTAAAIFVPSVYLNGTDVCEINAPGIVCENDVAVVAINQNGGQYLRDVTELYGIYDNPNVYVSFAGMKTAQITQLGYPVAFESGLKMIRTDSLGYQVSPNNLIIGSAQLGGSSGGPWLINFGKPAVTTTSTPSFDDSNRVAAVTSWGYLSNDLIKILGASRFGKNTNFTTKSNIRALLDTACSAYPTHC